VRTVRAAAPRRRAVARDVLDDGLVRVEVLRLGVRETLTLKTPNGSCDITTLTSLFVQIDTNNSTARSCLFSLE